MCELPETGPGSTTGVGRLGTEAVAGGGRLGSIPALVAPSPSATVWVDPTATGLVGPRPSAT